MSFEDICSERRVDREKIDKVKQHLIPGTATERLADTFKVLSDPTRLKIVFALLYGELCVCEIADIVEMSQSAVSHQLRKLKDHRLIKRRKSANMVYYSLDDDHIFKLLSQGVEHVQEDLSEPLKMPSLDSFK
ncbi:MAG: metalloregulator ArsR/SmtB family transcription factor [Actinomycetota bacterium]|nr:metalloregulator ArsR/SmtB family transcription factor [Actinomycetota bacterium]